MAKKVTRTISTRIAVEGERECQAAVTNLTSEFKKLESALKVAQNQFKNNANSIEALTAKDKALTNIQEAQTRALANAQKGFKNAENAAKEYRATKERLNTEIADNKKKLDELKSSQEDTAEEEERITKAIEELNNELVDNQNRLDAAERGMNKWQVSIDEAQMKLDDTNAEIEKNAQYLDEAKNSANGCAASIDRYGKSTEEAGRQSKEFGDRSKEGIEALSTALAAAGVAATVKEIAEALRECCDASIEFESAMAGVAKTNDLSEAELAQMSDSIKEMSERIPLTTTELAGIAEASGQLGIAKEDLLSFTETMAMLGTATNVTSDEAATMIAQFANVTGLDPDKYENLGSAIVDLGNNSATTESKIMELSQRFAAAASVAGFSETDILGFAAATSSLGIEADAGGSALSKLVSNIQLAVETGDGLNDFAAVAGMSADAFAQAWGVDAAGATAQFITGLNDTERNGKSAIAVLDEMGLSEVRLRNAVTSLAESGDLLTDSIARSSTAFKENTALSKEATTRYNTTESKIKLLKNSFNNLKVAIGDQLNPALGKLASAGKSVIDWATNMVKENKALVPVITAVVAGLAVMAAGITAITLASTIGAKAVAAFKAALDTATGGATFLITAITAVIAAFATLVLTLGDTSDRVTEEGQAMIDSCHKTSESFDDLQKKAEPLRRHLYELSTGMREAGESASVLSSDVSGTADSVDSFKGMLADIMFPVGDTKEAIENLGAAFDDLETSIMEAVQAQYEFQMWEILNSELSSGEKADALNALGKGYRDVKKSVDGTLGSFEGLFTAFEDGTGITSEMVDSLDKNREGMSQYGIQLEDTADTFVEQLERMQKGYKEGDEATVQYQQSTLTLAETFGNEFSGAISDTMMAIAEYREAQEQSREEIDAEIAAMEANIQAWEKKGNTLDMLIARQEIYGEDSLALIDSLTEEEKARLSQSDIDRIMSSENLYATLLEIAIENGANLTAQKDEYNALIEGKDDELNEKLKGNASDFAASVQSIYGDMSEAQVRQMFEMMEASGMQVDDGYKKMVLSALSFSDEAQKAVENDDFVNAMDKSIDAWEETTATGLDTTKSTIERTIGDIKDYINGTEFDPLKVEFDTDIKLPHFSLDGNFNVQTGAVPSVGIKWYDKGGLFTAPQIIGIAEERPEFVGAKEDLESFIRKAVAEAFVGIDPYILHGLSEEILNISNSYGGDIKISMPVTVKGKMTDAEIRRMTDQMVYTVRKKVGRLMN